MIGVVFICFIKVSHGQVVIACDLKNQPIAFGFNSIREELHKIGIQVKNASLNNNVTANIVIQVLTGQHPHLQAEGFAIEFKKNKLVITAIDETGAMYGAFDVAEQIRIRKSWQSIVAKTVNPHFLVRAVKFNLPWSSYRVGASMDQHLEVCRDLKFWQRFIDQMAKNRFNVISLWNVHPFSFMVKPTNFPGANNYSDAEMKEWKSFWTSLFRMMRDRGIQPFIVNWNIAVSPEFAKTYGVRERNDTSGIVKRYTKEVVAQVINEYPDLAGIGITLADWMSNFSSSKSSLPQMTPKDREDWIEQTVVAGIKAANRPVKFLHRSVLSSDPAEMRRVINDAALPDTTLVEIKFNWSHGHSTPTLALTHDSHSGKADDGYWNPIPENYRIQWMIRNEDMFILRWGQPDFIRRHISKNTAPYVNGYFVGSEGYIPAKDFSHAGGDHKTWEYAFEKQWLFYLLWGRLLYEPTTPDTVFESAFEQRYPGRQGRLLLSAFSSASKMPLRLASFYGATWDYTLYSEGFLAPFASNGGLHDTVSSFISIDELIDHPVLDPDYMSIPEFVKWRNEKPKTPLERLTPLLLADSLEEDSKYVLKIVTELRSGARNALACELDDLETWAYLGSYFANKIKSGVHLQTYRITQDRNEQQKAIEILKECVRKWERVSLITAKHYLEVPFVDDHSSGGKAFKDARKFSWNKYLPQVKRDIVLAQK